MDVTALLVHEACSAYDLMIMSGRKYACVRLFMCLCEWAQIHTQGDYMFGYYRVRWETEDYEVVMWVIRCVEVLAQPGRQKGLKCLQRKTQGAKTCATSIGNVVQTTILH